VSQIKETLVSQIDGLLVQHGGRNHAQRDQIPRLPHLLPFRDRGHVERASVLLRPQSGGSREFRQDSSFGLVDEREMERRALEEVEAVQPARVCPFLDCAQVGTGEECVNVFRGVLKSYENVTAT
jgi:hypothetical protein